MMLRTVKVDMPDYEYTRELYRGFRPDTVITLNGHGELNLCRYKPDGSIDEVKTFLTLNPLPEAPPAAVPMVRWQHGETGRICELPEGENPGVRWYRVEAPAAAKPIKEE